MNISQRFLILILLIPRSLSISVAPNPSSTLSPVQIPSNPPSWLDPPFLANVQAGITKALVQYPRCLFEGLSAIPEAGESSTDFGDVTNWLLNLDLRDSSDDTVLRVSIQSSTSHWGEWGRLFVFPYQDRGDTWFELSSIVLEPHTAWKKAMAVLSEKGGMTFTMTRPDQSHSPFPEAEITYIFTSLPDWMVFVGAQTGRIKIVPCNLPQGGNVTGECNPFVRNMDIDVNQLAKANKTALLTGGWLNVTGLSVMGE